ncbi:MAG: DUF721 domain-containing protein [Planctomycetes bacterium]|nr:DUF721 domain-containing protein [Planctomycetota bacterium]
MSDRARCRRVEYMDPVDDLKPGPVAVRDVLGAVLASFRRRVGRNDSTLAERWGSIVGREQAEASRVLSWKGGVLTVVVESPALLQEFQMFFARKWASEWSARYRDQPVDRIVFRLGCLQERHGRTGN